MRLCIPTVDESGLESRLSGHFGSAPYFTLVETETEVVEVVANVQAEHEHGRCDASSSLQGLNVDAVVCQGLGRRAFAGLRDVGIAVFVAEPGTVSSALASFSGGRARRMTSEEACRGGHQRGGHRHGGHHHGGGHGRAVLG